MTHCSIGAKTICSPEGKWTIWGIFFPELSAKDHVRTAFVFALTMIIAHCFLWRHINRLLEQVNGLWIFVLCPGLSSSRNCDKKQMTSTQFRACCRWSARGSSSRARLNEQTATKSTSQGNQTTSMIESASIPWWQMTSTIRIGHTTSRHTSV